MRLLQKALQCLSAIPPAKRPLLFLAVLPLMKWLYTGRRAEWNAYGIDGGYYLDLAQNVASGAGLVTDISPFNQGMPELPHPSPVYPLWPLVLGWVGRVVPLESAAYWVPSIFYFVALVFAWKLGSAWTRGRRVEMLGMEFHGGHALVFLFAFSFRFYESTSMPYTEGLAFTLLFAAHLRMHKLLPDLHRGTGGWRTLAIGVEAGAWAAVLFLVRSQFLLFFLAIAVVVPWVARAGGAWRSLVFGCSAAGTAVLVFLPEALRLSELSPHWFSGYLRFDQFQATAWLPRLDPEVKTAGIFEFIVNRLKGLWVSQIPGGHDSYSRGFHALAYAPLVLGGFLLSPRLRRDWWRGQRELWARPESATAGLFAVVFSFGAVVSLHNIHLNLWHEWHFGQRQALVAAFLIALCWIGLLEIGGAARRFAAILMVLSLVLGLRVVIRSSFGFHASPHSFVSRHSELVGWIKSRASVEGGARTVWVVPADWGKQLAPVTPDAAYHEYQEGADPARFSVFFERLGGKYLVLEKRTPPAKRTEFPALDERFLLIKETAHARVFRRL